MSSSAGRSTRPSKTRGRRKIPKPYFYLFILLLVGSATAATTTAIATSGNHRSGNNNRDGLRFEVATLDGGNNNRQNAEQGKAGQPYPRLARANYADGIGEPVEGPDLRSVSNRVFTDVHQNVFSENLVSQWGWVWGQFIDHDIGLRAEPTVGGKTETLNLAFDPDDPLETFTNSLGVIPFTRSAVTPGTGVNTPRQQTNTISSYINASLVYGTDEARLEWLRDGPVDGDLSNNSALLLMPDGLLPRRDARGDATTAPEMAADGRLLASPNRGFVAGDVRANENILLTATQTLFALEHNRIVRLLPSRLAEEQKFQIARRVVIAEVQWITYSEWLRTLGVRLPEYRGYNPRVDASITNEFATVAYRAHSMMHGGIEFEGEADEYDEETLEGLEDQGIEVARSEDGADVEFEVPLSVAFFNPDLLDKIGLDTVLAGVGAEKQYRNDERIDNQLRSVLFQVPVPDNPDCEELDGEGFEECFGGVVDLGAIDVARGRDHGMPTYNQLRRAMGLEPKRSFRAITGERTENFARGSDVNADSPEGLEFVRLLDREGNTVDPDADPEDTDVVDGIQRTTLAARLKAVHGSVDRLDAFTGMVAERHLRGTEFGELQLAMWRTQFQALRDGDRFFFGNDQGLRWIRQNFGIDFRRSLKQIIVFNTDVPEDELNDNVFRVAEQPAEGEPDADAGQGEASASADQTAAPTPSKSPSGSAVAGGVATNPRRARRRVRRVAPRLRPA